MTTPPGPLAEHGQRGRPRSQRSRYAVLAATVELLGELGFDSLSMDAIANQAGVSKATIYRWWPNKVALVVEAIDETAEEAITDKDTGSLGGDVASLMADLMTVLGSPRGKMVEAVAAASQHHPDLRQALDERFLAHRRELVVRVLQRAAGRGELRDGANPSAVADVVVAVLFYRIRLQPPALDSSIVAGLVNLLIDGLRRPPV